MSNRPPDANFAVDNSLKKRYYTPGLFLFLLCVMSFFLSLLKVSIVIKPKLYIKGRYSLLLNFLKLFCSPGFSITHLHHHDIHLQNASLMATLEHFKHTMSSCPTLWQSRWDPLYSPLVPYTFVLSITAYITFNQFTIAYDCHGETWTSI